MAYLLGATESDGAVVGGKTLPAWVVPAVAIGAGLLLFGTVFGGKFRRNPAGVIAKLFGMDTARARRHAIFTADKRVKARGSRARTWRAARARFVRARRTQRHLRKKNRR